MKRYETRISPGLSRIGIVGLAALTLAAAAPPPVGSTPAVPAQAATFTTAAPDAAAKPEAPAPAPKIEINQFASWELFGALIGMASYNTAYTAVTQGAASAATGALGLVTAAGAAAGLIWSGYGPGDEYTPYWNLVPAGLGALGGIAAGEVVIAGLFGYSPFVAGVAGYVPLTSLTWSRYANGALVYMSAILGAKAALGIYGVERQDTPHPDSGPPAPVVAPPPAPAAPARQGQNGA